MFTSVHTPLERGLFFEEKNAAHLRRCNATHRRWPARSQWRARCHSAHLRRTNTSTAPRADGVRRQYRILTGSGVKTIKSSKVRALSVALQIRVTKRNANRDCHWHRCSRQRERSHRRRDISDDDRENSQVSAPGWALPVGAFVVIATALLPLALSGGEDAQKAMARMLR